MNYSVVVEEAICKRDLLLKKNPDLMKSQKELDILLDKATSSESRVETVHMILFSRLKEMNQNSLADLVDKVNSLDQCFNKEKLNNKVAK